MTIDLRSDLFFDHIKRYSDTTATINWSGWCSSTSICYVMKSHYTLYTYKPLNQCAARGMLALSVTEGVYVTETEHYLDLPYRRYT